jgi:hypothetical protein
LPLVSLVTLFVLSLVSFTLVQDIGDYELKIADDDGSIDVDFPGTP